MSNLSLKAQPTTLEAALKAMGDRDTLKIGYETVLEKNGDVVYALHHGNRIVKYATDGTYATWAGWESPTTTNRLNKLTEGRFNIKNRSAHLNGEPVCSYSWHKVS